MPQVSNVNGRPHSQVKQNSEHNKAEVFQRQGPAPRDEIQGAFAGDQNEAKFHREDHPTKLKSRKTKKSAERTPKM